MTNLEDYLINNIIKPNLISYVVLVLYNSDQVNNLIYSASYFKMNMHKTTKYFAFCCFFDLSIRL